MREWFYFCALTTLALAVVAFDLVLALRRLG